MKMNQPKQRKIHDIITERLAACNAAGRLSLNVGIYGHVLSDGDCIGAATALAAYLENNYANIKTHIFLDHFKAEFAEVIPMIKMGRVEYEEPDNNCYFDISFVLDCAGTDRIAADSQAIERADYLVCIDHHLSNVGFGDEWYVNPDASSACEFLFSFFESEKMDSVIADSLLTGIVHDTGAFTNANVTKQTMETVGALIDAGGHLMEVVNKTFVNQSLIQQKAMGLALSKLQASCNGKIVYTYISTDEMKAIGAKVSDLDAIVDRVKRTGGAVCAMFAYPKGGGEWKFSLRSDGSVNVSEIALAYGGGGHFRAAGFQITGDFEELQKIILQELSDKIGQ